MKRKSEFGSMTKGKLVLVAVVGAITAVVSFALASGALALTTGPITDGLVGSLLGGGRTLSMNNAGTSKSPNGDLSMWAYPDQDAAHICSVDTNKNFDFNGDGINDIVAGTCRRDKVQGKNIHDAGGVFVIYGDKNMGNTGYNDSRDFNRGSGEGNTSYGLRFRLRMIERDGFDTDSNRDGKPEGVFIGGGIKNQELGTGVAAGGDLNGDGISDIAATAPGDQNQVADDPNTNRDDDGFSDTENANTGTTVIVYGHKDLPRRNASVSGVESRSIAQSAFEDCDKSKEKYCGHPKNGYGLLQGSQNKQNGPVTAVDIGPTDGSRSLNGDRRADVVVGGGSVAYVWYGENNSSTYCVEVCNGEISKSHLIFDVAIGGDANGDGRADLALGDPTANELAGGVYEIFGSATPSEGNVLDLVGQGKAINIRGERPFDPAEKSDPRKDFHWWEFRAKIKQELGEALQELEDRILSNDFPGDHLGWSVEFIGDMDGGGRDELAFGAPLASDKDNADKQNGRVYVLGGGRGAGTYSAAMIGQEVLPGMVYYGGAPGDLLGTSVGKAGDMDHDGYGDVLAGAPYASNDGSSVVDAHAGSEYVLPGRKIVSGIPGAGETRGNSEFFKLSASGEAANYLRIDGGSGCSLSQLALGSCANADQLGGFGNAEATPSYEPVSETRKNGMPERVPVEHYDDYAEKSKGMFGNNVAATADVNDDGEPDLVAGAASAGSAKRSGNVVVALGTDIQYPSTKSQLSKMFNYDGVTWDGKTPMSGEDQLPDGVTVDPTEELNGRHIIRYRIPVGGVGKNKLDLTISPWHLSMSGQRPDIGTTVSGYLDFASFDLTEAMKDPAGALDQIIAAVTTYAKNGFTQGISSATTKSMIFAEPLDGAPYMTASMTQDLATGAFHIKPSCDDAGKTVGPLSVNAVGPMGAGVNRQYVQFDFYEPVTDTIGSGSDTSIGGRKLSGCNSPSSIGRGIGTDTGTTDTGTESTTDTGVITEKGSTSGSGSSGSSGGSGTTNNTTINQYGDFDLVLTGIKTQSLKRGVVYAYAKCQGLACSISGTGTLKNKRSGTVSRTADEPGQKKLIRIKLSTKLRKLAKKLLATGKTVKFSMKVTATAKDSTSGELITKTKSRTIKIRK